MTDRTNDTRYEKPRHRSDCAVHNMPAMPAEACDCGAVDEHTKATSTGTSASPEGERNGSGDALSESHRAWLADEGPIGAGVLHAEMDTGPSQPTTGNAELVKRLTEDADAIDAAFKQPFRMTADMRQAAAALSRSDAVDTREPLCRVELVRDLLHLADYHKKANWPAAEATLRQAAAELSKPVADAADTKAARELADEAREEAKTFCSVDDVADLSPTGDLLNRTQRTLRAQADTIDSLRIELADVKAMAISETAELRAQLDSVTKALTGLSGAVYLGREKSVHETSAMAFRAQKIVDAQGCEWVLIRPNTEANSREIEFTPSEETVLSARTTICLSQAGESGCSCVKNSKPLGERGYCAGYERAARHILIAIAGSKE